MPCPRPGRTLSTALQCVGGLGIIALLLLGRQALDALLLAVNKKGALVDILPWVLAMPLVAAAQFFASTVQRERQQLLGDLVTRYVQGRVLDVTARVDLATFDDPDFHSRVQRIEASNHQALQMVYGVSGLVGSAFGAVGALVGVVAVAPVLLPLLVLVIVPAWLAASKRGDAFWEFSWKMTPGDRQRHYLASVLRERNAAKEVRAFGLTGYLRGRYDDLYAERITELRRVARSPSSSRTSSGSISPCARTSGGRVEAVEDLRAVRAAAAHAGADQFATDLPEGHETMLGPEFTGPEDPEEPAGHRGTDLSVGQWQRVALARALFRGAPFVILDEPTAALDPRAEQELFDTIRTLLDGRTVLFISHRFSSVRSADRIYVLEQGEVVESGSHAELMAADGLYAELFTLQAAAYLDVAGGPASLSEPG